MVRKLVHEALIQVEYYHLLMVTNYPKDLRKNSLSHVVIGKRNSCESRTSYIGRHMFALVVIPNEYLLRPYI